MEDLLKVKERMETYLRMAENCRKYIHDNCTCPSEHLQPGEYYFSGSYNDTAYTDYWDECQICKRRHNKRTKSHSWYG